MKKQPLLLSVGLAVVIAILNSPPAKAADLVAAPAVTPNVTVPVAACLRWEWRQYAWYDDCWWARHPYIGQARWGSARRY